MIQRSIQESYKLAAGSGKQAAAYVAASLLAAWLYVLVCGFFGVENAYGGGGNLESSPVGGVLAYLPGMAVAGWFAAGLTGRFTAQACGAEARPLSAYANTWVVRKVGWDVFFMFLMWLPLWILKLEIWGGRLIVILWMISGIWLAVRLSLWLNAAVSEDLRLLPAMKRSMALTEGRIWTLILIGGIPMAAIKLLSWLLGRLVGGKPAAAYYLNSLLDGVGAVIVMGAFAAAYSILRSGAAQAEAPAGENGTFWGRSE